MKLIVLALMSDLLRVVSMKMAYQVFVMDVFGLPNIGFGAFVGLYIFVCTLKNYQLKDYDKTEDQISYNIVFSMILIVVTGLIWMLR